MRVIQGRPVLAALVVVALGGGVLSGCGYAEKKRQAQIIIDSVKHLEEQGTASGRLAMTLRLSKQIALTATTKAPKGAAARPKPTLSAATVPVSLDFVHLRAAAVPPTAPAQGAAAPAAGGLAGLAGRAGAQAGAGTPNVGNLAALSGASNLLAASLPEVWNRGTFYLHRPDGKTDADVDQRPWFQLDFHKLSRAQQSELQEVPLLNVVNPAYLVQLLGGTLSGSVKKLNIEQVAGVPTVKYEMNIDRDKAARRLSDKDRESLANVFGSNHLTGTIYRHAEVWIDESGVPRKMILPLKQTITQNKLTTIFDVSVTIELTKLGGPADITVPSVDNTTEVDSLNALYASVRS